MSYLKSKILIFFIFVQILIFSTKDNFMEINIIHLNDIFGKKLLNDFKLPFDRVLYTHTEKIISEKYKRGKNNVFEKQNEKRGSYEKEKLECVLEEIFKKEIEDDFYIFCDECRILGRKCSVSKLEFKIIYVYV